MCTYNGAEFLPAQWESILAQSRKPDEIVVCDDGSSDQTRSLLENFASESPLPVTLQFNQNNLGSVKNFEQAIRLCTGSIIALSDQDDVWRSDKLETIEAALNNDLKVGLVFSDAEIVSKDLEPLGRRMWTEVCFGPYQQKQVARG